MCRRFVWAMGVVCLGVLTVWGWNQYVGHHRSRAVREIKALRAALEVYAVGRQQRFPRDAGPDWQEVLLHPGVRPRLIGAVLRDPFSASRAPYRYAVSENGRTFVIWSVGPNGTSEVAGVDDAGRVLPASGDDLWVIGRLADPDGGETP